MALTDKLTAIADAIRAKTGGTAVMTPAEMPLEIAAIPAPPERYIVYEYDPTITNSSPIVAAHMYGYESVPQWQFLVYNSTSISPWVNMAEVTADSPLKSIEDSAFWRAGALTTIDLSAVETIDVAAFRYCAGLTVAQLPSVVTVGANAFRDCTGLTEIHIGANVESMHYTTFANCPALTDIYIDQLQAESPVAADAPWSAPNARVHWREAT